MKRIVRCSSNFMLLGTIPRLLISVKSTYMKCKYQVHNNRFLQRSFCHVADKDENDLKVMFGDIVVYTGLQNADPCTARGCLWPKSSDGNVYVPYRISNEYSQRERDTIIQGLQSFSRCTCIRFTPRRNQRDFVDIQCRSGCYSFVGRRGNGQVLSLNRRGCVYHSIIQHELLHALGFNHEQTRSDRDEHVRILLQNVIQHNFWKIQNSRNLGTPYDYNSVMHYGRYAFSSNGQPTIVPVPNPDVSIGRANQMSPTDILRVNRLYGTECNQIRRNWAICVMHSGQRKSQCAGKHRPRVTLAFWLNSSSQIVLPPELTCTCEEGI
uniref:Metalloendopeptidase n=1 Tax=Myripristis murdjan TaxID=586833 RepID=A0A667ZYU5_9TELE